MNERIEKLAKKAGFGVYGEIYSPNDEDSPITKNIEKFAELIIKECEKVAKDGPWYYDAPSCGWRNPINFVCKEMKEHFGVEE